jgi:outer membrane protein
MKKLIVAVVMGLGIFNASAQNKIGYISTDELVGAMPEYVKVTAELKEYQASLSQQGEDMSKDLEQKLNDFNRDSSKFTPSMKDIKRNELSTLYQRLGGWNQTAQDMYQQEAQKKIQPINAKALEAIQAVAKENGYGYVFDVSTLLVFPPSDNLLSMVKKKLNIKDTPATTPGAGAPAQKPATTTPKN